MNWKQETEIINKKAKFYTRQLWNIKLDVPIVFNGKLKRTAGYLFCDSNNNPLIIHIAKYLLNQYQHDYYVDDVLIHELCHWYSIKNNLPCKDGQLEFEELLRCVGVSSSATLIISGEYHTLKCTKCGLKIGNTVYKSVALKYCNFDLYYSKCCKSEVEYSGIEVLKSNYIPSDKLVCLADKIKGSDLPLKENKNDKKTNYFYSKI